eukprot:TRINITY_DN20107_c0_g1_i1.p1 TRINITY_DN20107_c0_g1~~TRINITY_DN20107_c0_g1_i1.p1  ORF type:complete len:640 (-),score=53.40 TRINITY_DN20107_c0_g1_i1:292-2211(-)
MGQHFSSVHASAFVTEYGSIEAEEAVVPGPRPFEKAEVESDEQSEEDDVVVTFDVSEVHQPMLGFGAALTEASSMVLCNSPSKDKILDDLFLPPDKGGAGITCLRIPIGSSDFALDAFTYQKDSESAFDASREEHLRLPILQDVKRRNPHVALIATPWSAPAWMKDSGRLEGGSLRHDMMDDYSRMLLETILFYERKGMPLYAITVQNEPYYETSGYPSMLMSPEQQGMLAQMLVRLLRSNGLSTRVVGHDHNYDLAGRCKRMLRAAGGLLDGTAWHAYGGHPCALDAPAIQAGGIYVTEQTGHTNRPKDADFNGDIDWMMRNVIMGPVLHGARCGLAWNVALDEDFGPRVPGGPTNCRGVVEVQKCGTHARGPEFYGLMHFCHATAADEGETCWRVGTSTSASSISAVGFVSTGGKVSLVLQNSSDDVAIVSIRCSQADETVIRFVVPPRSLLSAKGYTYPVDGHVCFPSDELRLPVSEFSFPPAFALRSVSNGTFVAAHGEIEDLVYQSRSRCVGEWETWRVIEVKRRVFVFKSFHNTYLARRDDYSLCQVDNEEDASHFLVFVLPTGRVCLNTDRGSMIVRSWNDLPAIEMAKHAPNTTFDVVALDETMSKRLKQRVRDRLFIANYDFCHRWRAYF